VRISQTWWRWLFALALAGALAAAACGGGNDSSPTRRQNPNEPTLIGAPSAVAPSYPIEVRRSDGKTLTVAQAPKRIVSLSPGATEILYAIGAEAQIAAVDKQADYPDAAKNFPTKVDAFEPNVEAIAALQPDLVIVATDINGLVARLDSLNIPVYFADINTDIKTVDDVMTQINLLGRVTGHAAQAGTLLDTLGARLRAVKDKVQGINQTTSPKVYHELDSTFFTAAEGSFVGDLYRTLRARNIAGDGGGNPYPQMTQEAIIASDPDVIVLADEEFGVSIDSVKARPGWANISAVKNNRIVAIDPDIISRPGPRIVDALEQLGKAIYPERFQ
jgi:iron complex transport system substrate-binding protein